MLGALLLVVSLWPFTCAALPIASMTPNESTFRINKSATILSNLTDRPIQRKSIGAMVDDYSNSNSESEQYSSSQQLHHDDLITLPTAQQTVFLRRKRKKANTSNRSTSYTIRNYFYARRPPQTIIQNKELSSSTPQTLHSNDLYLAGTQSSQRSKTTIYEPAVGFRKLSSLSSSVPSNANNSIQMRLSQATIQNELASVSTTTQLTTSIKLNQKQTDDDSQSKLNRSNNGARTPPVSSISSAPSNMFLNQTISSTLQTVFSPSSSGSKRLQITSTENSIYSRTERSVPDQYRHSARTGKKPATGKRNSNLDRNERSTNFSHIIGTSRKIQLLIKNRLLQLLPDGTVNGTHDDGSDYSEYTIFFLSFLIKRLFFFVGRILPFDHFIFIGLDCNSSTFCIFNIRGGSHCSRSQTFSNWFQLDNVEKEFFSQYYFDEFVIEWQKCFKLLIFYLPVHFHIKFTSDCEVCS